MRIRSLSSALVLGALAFFVGCTDLPTVPDIAVVPEVSAGKKVNDVLHDRGKDGQKGKNGQNGQDGQDGQDGQEDDGLVNVMEWFSPLKQDEVVSGVIGPLGGKIQLNKAGFMFKVPPGALTENVTITITAKAGKYVGYEFQPHGLQFLLPAEAQQNARNLAAPSGRGKKDIFAAYYEGELLPQVKALEILGIELTGGSQHFFVHHFSGYVIATD